MESRIAGYQTKLTETNNTKTKENLSIKIAEAKIRVENSKAELLQLELQKSEIVDKFAQEKKIYIELKYNN